MSRGDRGCVRRGKPTQAGDWSPLPPPAGEPRVSYPLREEGRSLGAIFLLQSIYFLIGNVNLHKQINCH